MVEILGECLTGDTPSTDDVRSLRGFVKLKKIKKIQEKLGSGWIGQAPARIFFSGNIMFFSFFLVVFFVVHVSKKTGGWVGDFWTIRVFLGFLDFF